MSLYDPENPRHVEYLDRHRAVAARPIDPNWHSCVNNLKRNLSGVTCTVCGTFYPTKDG